MLRPRSVVGGALVLLLTIWGVSLWLSARQVKADLESARSEAERVAAVVRGGSAPSLEELQQLTRRAHERTGGLHWRGASYLPVLGRDVRAVREAARAAALLTHEAAPPLVRALATARGSGLVHTGAVDLVALDALHREVASAAEVTSRARELQQDRPGHGWAESRLRPLREKTEELGRALALAQEGLRVTPAMLGGTAPRRYLVAVQNNAEARATGGLIGIVALVRAEAGRIALERTVTNDALAHASARLPIDPEAAGTWFRQGLTRVWYNATLSPHAPDSARSVAGLWHAQTGQRVDGVVLVDSVSMQALLTSPVRVGSTTLAKTDVVDWVSRREYVEHPDPKARKALLRQLADAVFAQATRTSTGEPFLDAARSGHLFVWSARPAEQAFLLRTPLGGSLPADDRPYLQVVSQNAGGNKLDYYLERTVSVVPRGRYLAVSVTLTNRAPRGLPEYMTFRSDRPAYPVSYGQARVLLSLYGARSTLFAGTTVNGSPAAMVLDRDHGHRMGTMFVEVPRGRPVVVEFLVSQPAGPLTYRQQPLLRPDTLDIRIPHRVVGGQGPR